MSILVIAEHDNSSLKQATLNVVAAAKAIGGDIDVLVAGKGAADVAAAAAKISGLSMTGLLRKRDSVSRRLNLR